MLTQLNSTYYELGIALRKASDRLENQYKQLKIAALLKIRHFHSDSIDVRAREEEHYRRERQRKNNNEDEEPNSEPVHEENKMKEIKNIQLQRMDASALRC
jgi:hypothetical protein